MKLFGTNKLTRLSRLFAFAMGLSAAMFSSSALSMRATAASFNYYSDATYTEMVGETDCSCYSCVTTGTVTAYEKIVEEYACY